MLWRNCRDILPVHQGWQLPRARKRVWFGSVVSLWAKPLPRRRVCTRRLFFSLPGLTRVPVRTRERIAYSGRSLTRMSPALSPKRVNTTSRVKSPTRMTPLLCSRKAPVMLIPCTTFPPATRHRSRWCMGQWFETERCGREIPCSADRKDEWQDTPRNQCGPPPKPRADMRRVLQQRRHAAPGVRSRPDAPGRQQFPRRSRAAPGPAPTIGWPWPQLLRCHVTPRGGMGMGMGDRAFASATELSLEIRDRHIGCVTWRARNGIIRRLTQSSSGRSTRRENAPAPPMPPLRAASVGDRCTAFR